MTEVIIAAPTQAAPEISKDQTKKARCREEVAAGSISNVVREEVHPIQRRHRIWEE
ncbi:hypothetical protein X743_12750 [Mesorhizobium sp. LNHC252B00]|nr:hypothetical protein X743_12750 [Mesorhizobium sp. LNHC252B00]